MNGNTSDHANDVTAAARKSTVLLVEDEFLINDMVAQALSEGGFDVHAVFNAAEALDYLSSHAPDVLFTDINLAGGMNGADLACRARVMRPDIAVVYASGRYCAIDQISAVPQSVFLPKPYNLFNLCTIIAGMMGRNDASPAGWAAAT